MTLVRKWGVPGLFPKPLWVLPFLFALLPGCKAVINPSVPPEGDADIPVAQAEAELRRTNRPVLANQSTIRQITLTVNNAPGPDQPLELEVMQRLVDLFERRNPGIRIQFSPWRFTPESFFERLSNRTLTDIVEINAAQLPAILEVNGAADITENVALHPEVRLINPAALALSVRDGRFYGIPGEMHTLALFYNRKLLAAATAPAPAAATPTPAPSNRRRGRGASDDSDPEGIAASEDSGRLRGFLAQAAQGESAIPSTPERLIAQESQRTRRPRSRAQQEVQEYYQVEAPASEPAPRRRGIFRNWFRATREEEPAPAPQPVSTPKPRKTPDPAALDTVDGVPGEPGTTPPSDNPDVLPSDPNERVEIRAVDPPTPMVAVAGLPKTWDQFISLAVRLTDHQKGIYGFAPVLFSREGGREFAQWGVQAGLGIMMGARGNDITLDVNSATAASVVQFLKDLRWRHDVAPPPEMCYRDNLMRLFANGRLAMMVLPADRESIATLLKMGLPMDDLGIAPLPGGPKNRKHLVHGSYWIINSQIDAERRAAAFKWLLFMSDAETQLIRQQFFHQEGELTGAPAVARYTANRQASVRESMRRTMRVPIFLDYDDVMADSAQLALEPPHFTDRFFESLAEDVRPMIENKDSDPSREISRVGMEFLKRYVIEPTSTQGAARYLEIIQGLINRQNPLSGNSTPRTP